MRKQIVTLPESTKPFSSAIQSGPFVFVSGQGGLDSQTGEVVGLICNHRLNRRWKTSGRFYMLQDL